RADRGIVLHDAGSAKELRRLNQVCREPTYMTFSPDGTKLATLTVLQEVRLWDVATGQVTILIGEQSEELPHRLNGFNDERLAFSADGKTLAVAVNHPAVRRFD